MTDSGRLGKERSSVAMPRTARAAEAGRVCRRGGTRFLNPSRQCSPAAHLRGSKGGDDAKWRPHSPPMGKRNQAARGLVPTIPHLWVREFTIRVGWRPLAPWFPRFRVGTEGFDASRPSEGRKAAERCVFTPKRGSERAESAPGRRATIGTTNAPPSGGSPLAGASRLPFDFLDTIRHDMWTNVLLPNRTGREAGGEHGKAKGCRRRGASTPRLAALGTRKRIAIPPGLRRNRYPGVSWVSLGHSGVCCPQDAPDGARNPGGRTSGAHTSGAHNSPPLGARIHDSRRLAPTFPHRWGHDAGQRAVWHPQNPTDGATKRLGEQSGAHETRPWGAGSGKMSGPLTKGRRMGSNGISRSAGMELPPGDPVRYP
jgi:hypothetical protein